MLDNTTFASMKDTFDEVAEQEAQLQQDLPTVLTNLATAATLLSEVQHTLSPYLLATTPTPAPAPTPTLDPLPQPPLGPVLLSQLPVGVSANLGGWRPFPDSHPFNTDISSAPLNDFSGLDATQTAPGSVFGGNHLQLDPTIPFAVVDSSLAPASPVAFSTYPDESDIMPYPLAGGAIEGAGTPGGDRHCIVLDKASGFIFEAYATADDKKTASNGAIFDAVNGSVRPTGMTSADAAGLAILPLLLKFQDLATGPLRHALRFTMNHCKINNSGGWFTPPASHGAGDNWGTSNVLGQRIRLKASFDLTSAPPICQNLGAGLKAYGMFLADTGSSGYVTADTDPQWFVEVNGASPMDTIQAWLKTVHLSDFELLAPTGAQMYDMTTAPQPAAPVIASLTVSKNAGGTVTLTWSETGASYCYLEGVAPVRGTSYTAPYVAGQVFTLVACNANATKTRAQVTVT